MHRAMRRMHALPRGEVSHIGAHSVAKRALQDVDQFFVVGMTMWGWNV